MTNIVRIETLQRENLNSLVHEACTLGWIRVWQSSEFNDRPKNHFEVTITFRTKRGSKIEAKASHSSLECAFADAINEARELGAGEQ